jgi:glucose dehydrogenase
MYRIIWIAILTVAAWTELTTAGQTAREWRDYAGGPDSSRFVTSTQITKANVNQLQVAWSFPAGQTDFNPVVVRGVVYGRGRNGAIVALDAPGRRSGSASRCRP